MFLNEASEVAGHLEKLKLWSHHIAKEKLPFLPLDFHIPCFLYKEDSAEN